MIDSEYTNHIFFDKNEFIEYRPYREEVIVINEVTIWTQERDTVEMKWLLKNEISNIVRVENVLHVSDFICELFSISQIIKKGFEIAFLGDDYYISKNNVLVESALKTRNIYILNMSQSTAKIAALIQENTRALFTALIFNEDAVELWHRRIKHLNEIDLKRLVNMSKGITLTQKPRVKPICEACSKAKSSRKISRRQQREILEKLDKIHIDLRGLFNVSSINEVKYYMLLTYQAHRHTVTFCSRPGENWDSVIRVSIYERNGCWRAYKDSQQGQIWYIYRPVRSQEERLEAGV